MRSPLRVSRRVVLVWLGGGAAALGAGGLALWRRRRRSDATVVAAVASVGRAYLAEVPSEASVDVLLRLLPDVGAPEDLARSLSRLDRAVAEDFAHERTVLVDGWVLSRTEARAAALVALAGPVP